WREPAGRYLKIGTEQNVIFCLNLLQRFVISVSKSFIDWDLERMYRRKVCMNVCQRIFGRCIIHNHHIIASFTFRYNGWQKKLMPFSAVIAENDDSRIMMAYNHCISSSYLYFGWYKLLSGTSTFLFDSNLCSQRL